MKLLKTDSQSFSEKLVAMYQCTQHRVPERGNLLCEYLWNNGVKRTFNQDREQSCFYEDLMARESVGGLREHAKLVMLQSRRLFVACTVSPDVVHHFISL
jgi:hypothetical protein